MLNKLLILILRLVKKVKGKSLARPTIVKFEQGEIVLKNLSKETTDRMKQLILTLDTESLLLAPPAGTIVEEVETKEKSDMTDVALSLRKNSSGSYEIVTVGFNDKKEATVLEVKDVGPHKAIASGMFRVEVSNRYL